MDSINNYVNGFFKTYDGNLSITFESSSIILRNIDNLSAEIFLATGIYYSGPKIFVFDTEVPFSYLWVDSENKISIGNLKSKAIVVRDLMTETLLTKSVVIE